MVYQHDASLTGKAFTYRGSTDGESVVESVTRGVRAVPITHSEVAVAIGSRSRFACGALAVMKATVSAASLTKLSTEYVRDVKDGMPHAVCVCAVRTGKEDIATPGIEDNLELLRRGSCQHLTEPEATLV